jgi:hypothetical protein
VRHLAILIRGFGGLLLLTSCQAATPPEAEFASDCTKVAEAAREYLTGRGFAESSPSQGGFSHFYSGRKLLDAAGKRVSSGRIRREFAEHIPWVEWGGPLHASAEIRLASTSSGCRMSLRIWFGSNGVTVVGVLPIDGGMVLKGNGKLESSYADAMKAKLESVRAQPPSAQDPAGPSKP